MITGSLYLILAACVIGAHAIYNTAERRQARAQRRLARRRAQEGKRYE